MPDLRHEILKYLEENDSGNLIPLNDKLHELLGSQPMHNLKGLFREMSKDQVVEISGNTGWLGSTIGGVEQNLTNHQIRGRILSKGYKELREINMQNSAGKTVGISGVTLNNSSISNSSIVGGNSDKDVGIFNSNLANTHLTGLNISGTENEILNKNDNAKSIWFRLLKFLGENILKIIVGLIIIYFAIKLGWKR
ncbi:MAG: hypothetical protein ABI207_03315 [Crocinitomicaceae bacterium]